MTVPLGRLVSPSPAQQGEAGGPAVCMFPGSLVLIPSLWVQGQEGMGPPQQCRWHLLSSFPCRPRHAGGWGAQGGEEPLKSTQGSTVGVPCLYPRPAPRNTGAAVEHSGRSTALWGTPR